MARDNARAVDSRTRPKIEQPWKGFVPSIRPHIEQMLVSHRPEHKLSGELHDETNYGRPYEKDKKTIVHIRKRVVGLSTKDLDNIVDPEVKKSVVRKAIELKGDLAACENQERLADAPETQWWHNPDQEGTAEKGTQRHSDRRHNAPAICS